MNKGRQFDSATERALFCFGERVGQNVLNQNLAKQPLRIYKEGPEELVLGPRQKEPESMLGEVSCAESLAKDDHVEVRDHQEDVDESDPVSTRERRE